MRYSLGCILGFRTLRVQSLSQRSHVPMRQCSLHMKKPSSAPYAPSMQARGSAIRNRQPSRSRAPAAQGQQDQLGAPRIKKRYLLGLVGGVGLCKYGLVANH